MNRLQHSIKQGEKEVFYEQKNCMISEWEKRDDCWTNIDSPGLVREQKLRGHLETRRPVLLDLSGYKKNGMRVLWKDSLESLRQEGTLGTGFILWRCTDLPGSGGAASIMSEVWKREAGKTGMACGQSLLHEANCLFCRTEVPDYDRKGCGEGVQSGLGYGEDIRQRYMKKQLLRYPVAAPRVIGIDEISIRKGHTYRIVVSDLERGRPIWFGGKDRSKESLDIFYQWLGAKKVKKIRLAVMDM